MPEPGSLELVCPAGSLAMLRAAVEAGADSVYCGLSDETNARNFPGLNLLASELSEAVAWTRARGARLLLAVNTFATAGKVEAWRRHREREDVVKVTEAVFTYVALGPDRRPRTLPPAE